MSPQVIKFPVAAQQKARDDDERTKYLEAVNAVPNADGSPKILHFGDGLDLWVRRPTLKVWRCKVQRNKKRTTLNLGYFPAMTIKAARKARFDVMAGGDPGQERRDAKVAAAVAEATTFKSVAEVWVDVIAPKKKWTPAHKTAVEAQLANHVYPVFGERPIAEVTTTDVQRLIGSLYAKTPKAAVMVKHHVSRVLGFAWANDQVTSNVAEKIKEYLPSRTRAEEKSHAYVGTIEDARRVLAAVEKRALRKDISPYTVLAHRLMALTGCRKNEVLGARWEEFDLAGAVWTVPAVRMKGKNGQRREHKVPLAPQAIALIEAANRLRKDAFVFPANNGRRGYAAKHETVSRCTLNKLMERALRLDGLDPGLMVPHGWRSTFSTVMNEIDEGSSFRVVDAMLAHKAFRDSVEEVSARKSSVEGHYNHAQYRSARHAIACRWADMLLDGAPSALALIGLEEAPTKVVPIRKRGAK